MKPQRREARGGFAEAGLVRKDGSASPFMQRRMKERKGNGGVSGCLGARGGDLSPL